MKLIFCARCHDVFKLSKADTRCDCKKSGGYYAENGNDATVYGLAVPLGFNNYDFAIAVSTAKKAGTTSPRFEAFVIREPCDAITRLK